MPVTVLDQETQATSLAPIIYSVLAEVTHSYNSLSVTSGWLALLGKRNETKTMSELTCVNELFPIYRTHNDPLVLAVTVTI